MVSGCLVIFLIAQDDAIFGGLSTDVNSMIPVAWLVWCASPSIRSFRVRKLLLPKLNPRPFGLVTRSLALAMVIAAIIPMATSLVSNGAETTLFLARNHQFSLVNFSPSPFTLTDQNGQTFSFPRRTDRYTVMTFLDPACYTDCPLLAHQLEDLFRTLTPTEQRHVQFIAIAANPLHETGADLRTFIAKNSLGVLHHFVYLTGKLSTISQTWTDYGIQVSPDPKSVMSIHSDVMYVFDPSGKGRVIIPDDPARSWAGEISSATALLNALHQAGLK